jgi:iron(III) transport system substrate-binding protein
MRNPRFIAGVAGALLSLVLAACGGSPSARGPNAAANSGVEKHAKEVYDQINALSGEARRTKLVELAKKEGRLSIYTSNTDIDALVEGFEKAYGINVTVYRGNSESVLQRTLQEQRAGFYGADVLETNAGELNVANKEGFLSEYKSELRDKVRKEGQAAGWTASRFNVFVVGWNTNRVKPGQEPKTIEELAEPRYKGRISMEMSDVDWFAALHDYYRTKGKSEQEVLGLFRRIAANAKVAKGHTVQGELLSAGQFDIALSAYSHTIDKAAKKGAPVAWRPAQGKPVQPIVIRPNGIGLMKTAKNPAAAMLFVDWELTEAQRIFAGLFRIGSVVTGEDKLAGLELVPVPEQELLSDPKKWDGLYADIVQGGEKVDG